MQLDTQLPIVAIINDIDALIDEIDDNPRLSPWVVRLVLKSIKDKARRMVTQRQPEATYLQETVSLEAFLNPSPSSNAPIKALNGQ